ncbi:MAG: preprotein translocase subunit SecE [Planctomycetales bacterium]
MAKQKELTFVSVAREMFNPNIYKPSQGRITRQVTGAAVGITLLLGCYRMHLTVLLGQGIWQYLLPFGILLPISLWISYRIVCIPQFADFLIATEAEMNEVSWPSRGELFRGSTVVLVTIFFMAAVLFGYDFFWRAFFMQIGVL